MKYLLVQYEQKTVTEGFVTTPYCLLVTQYLGGTYRAVFVGQLGQRLPIGAVNVHVMTRQDVADHVGGCIQNTRLRLLKGYRKIEFGAQEIPQRPQPLLRNIRMTS